jgi:hypothetical protein
MRIFLGLAEAAREMDHLGHDLAAFGEHILNRVIVARLRESGEKQVKYIQEKIIGHDQPGWPSLEESTEERKTREGFDTGPLERTGELRDSYDFDVIEEGPALVVGSTSKVAVDQELGTSHNPPRPVLTPTAQRFEEEMAEILADNVAAAIVRVSDMSLIGIPGIGMGDLFDEGPKKPING